MLDALALAAVSLALLYAALTVINLASFHVPRRAPKGARPSVSLLIPARDEAANIDAALGSALASEGVDLEVVVLDDGSTDGTARGSRPGPPATRACASRRARRCPRGGTASSARAGTSLGRPRTT